MLNRLNKGGIAPHPALDALLEWWGRRGGDEDIRKAARRAQRILHDWRAKRPRRTQRQMHLFLDEEEMTGATSKA